MNSTLRPRRRGRPGIVVTSVVWFVILVAMSPLVALVALTKHGSYMEGSSGDPAGQLVEWTLLAAPYVFVLGMLVLAGYLVAAHLLDLPRRSSFALETILALGTFGLLAYGA